MSTLQKLVDRCNELDITEQLNIFGDASIQYQAKEELAALQARVAEQKKKPDVQKKVKEFSEVFEWLCRITLYGDGSGNVEYSHPDGWIHIHSFDTVAEFMRMDVSKLKEACNL